MTRKIIALLEGASEMIAWLSNTQDEAGRPTGRFQSPPKLKEINAVINKCDQAVEALKAGKSHLHVASDGKVYYHSNSPAPLPPTQGAYLGDFVVGDDGYAMYFPDKENGGGFDSYILRLLAEALDEKNAPWDEIVQRELGPPK